MKPSSNIYTFPRWFAYEPGSLVTDENGTYFSACGIMGGPSGRADDLAWADSSDLLSGTGSAFAPTPSLPALTS